MDSEQKSERNRRNALGGGNPNEQGITQGQNGEQGNAVDPTQSTSIGRTPH